MKGRKPKTTAEHKANGTYQPARHADRLEVPTRETLPPAPAHFDKEHADEWQTLCRLLQGNGLLTDADLDAVQVYVESKVTARRTYTVLVKEKFIQDGRKHPLHMVYSDAVKTMRALSDQFGLNPRARMSIKVEKPKQESSILEMMKGRKRKIG